jgi:hypothetical protein
MSFAMKWGPLRLAANMAFISLAYAKHLPPGPQRNKYGCWGAKQMK